MRFPFLHYLGGFLWWVFIEFCKTNLETEQTEDKRIRNIIFSIAIGTVSGFIAVKCF